MITIRHLSRRADEDAHEREPPIASGPIESCEALSWSGLFATVDSRHDGLSRWQIAGPENSALAFNEVLVSLRAILKASGSGSFGGSCSVRCLTERFIAFENSEGRTLRGEGLLRLVSPTTPVSCHGPIIASGSGCR